MSAGGLSEARLRRMGDVMAGHVERGVPGLVWLVSRRGEVHVEALGSATLASAEHDAVPMRRDTIFRFASHDQARHRSRRDDPGGGVPAARSTTRSTPGCPSSPIAGC